MKRLILFLVLLVCLTSCQKTCSRFSKNWQMTDRNYHIEQYSGGKCIGTYNFRGILNDAEGSDGYYFFRGDTLIEVSGELIIKSTD